MKNTSQVSVKSASKTTVPQGQTPSELGQIGKSKTGKNEFVPILLELEPHVRRRTIAEFVEAALVVQSGQFTLITSSANSNDFCLS